MKTKKMIFNHPRYEKFANKYVVTNTGRVFKKNGDELKYFTSKNKKSSFVRLFQNGNSLSICVAKLVLLTFKPQLSKKNKIAIHLDGVKSNNHINNLIWGTRQTQSLIHMKDPKNYRRIQKMGKKYGKKNGRINGKKYGKYNLLKFFESKKILFSKETIIKIKSLLKKKYTPTEISKKLNIGRSSIYRYI